MLLARISTVLGLFALSVHSSHSAPSKRQSQFRLLSYSDFQISDGVAGDAEAKAAAVFVDPFAGVDLATVDEDTLVAVKTMRELAEDAETDFFNPQIDAASGADAEALEIGKSQNKVLKLTGFAQALRIEIAQLEAAGEDASERQTKLDEELTKLNKNIATDKANAGAASKGITGTVPVRSGRPQPGGSSAGSDAPALAEPAPAPDTVEEVAPVAEDPVAEEPVAAAPSTFAFRDYADFQISDGVAGNAKAEAAAVVAPFANVDLASVSDADLASLSTMRELAEDAETQLFNPEIEAASGAEADALQVGKIKNKVLKLAVFEQVLKIKIAKADAAGEDSSADAAKLVEEQGKLAKNIATDEASAGAPSKAATGTVSPRSRKLRSRRAANGASRLARWY